MIWRHPWDCLIHLFVIDIQFMWQTVKSVTEVALSKSFLGFIDFIVEPTMVVCGELLTKMVEPLVSLPPSDSLFPPGNDHPESTSPSNALSPLPPDMLVFFLLIKN